MAGCRGKAGCCNTAPSALAMPRRPRLELPGVPMHVTQRGVNRGAMFIDDEDRTHYMSLLAETTSLPTSKLPCRRLRLQRQHKILASLQPDPDRLRPGHAVGLAVEKAAEAGDHGKDRDSHQSGQNSAELRDSHRPGCDGCPDFRTRARSSNACAATSRARRSARSAYRSRRRAGCATSSRRRGRTARRTWSLSRWTSSPSWRRWYRHRGRTSPASTKSLLRASCPNRSRRICAPNAKLRAQLPPSGRGKRPPTDEASTGANSDHRSPDERRRSMTPDQVRGRLWAQRLKRVFNIDVKTCNHCGGSVRIVASIEEPTAIRAILAHFAKHGAREKAHYRPAARAPPAVAA